MGATASQQKLGVEQYERVEREAAPVPWGTLVGGTLNTHLMNYYTDHCCNFFLSNIVFRRLMFPSTAFYVTCNTLTAAKVVEKNNQPNKQHESGCSIPNDRLYFIHKIWKNEKRVSSMKRQWTP